MGVFEKSPVILYVHALNRVAKKPGILEKPGI